MSNPLDTDAGSELFASYEADLRLVQADLNQKLDQIPEQTGEPRKATIRQAEHALEEASELVRLPPLELYSIADHAVTYSSTRCASRNKTSPHQPEPRSTSAFATSLPTLTHANGSSSHSPTIEKRCSVIDTPTILRHLMSSWNSANSCCLGLIDWDVALIGSERANESQTRRSRSGPAHWQICMDNDP
jgi:hypothetical protein